MRTSFVFVGFTVIAASIVGKGWAATEERLFVLTDAAQLRQFAVDFQHAVAAEKTYTATDLPSAFPAAALEVASGNLLRLVNDGGKTNGTWLLEPKGNQLVPFANDPGDVASLRGRILVAPDLAENIRGTNSLYAAKTDPAFAASMLREKVGQSVGAMYRDVFVLDGQAFGTNGDRVERLTNRDGSPATSAAGLTLSNAKLGRAVVSPWGEAFIADSGGKCVQRVVWRNGQLESNGAITDAALIAPAALAFDTDGELFVATGSTGANAVQHYRFTLENFITWRASLRGGVDLGSAKAVDLALSRPAGYVISEKTNPLVEVVTGGANPHHGISQALYVGPAVNSETATVALVQYAPGGFTAVHKHPQMEQMEIVLSGRAIWEVGEVEREVGPGDVVFCPRNVKHGYRVIGNEPFKFYQVEWREWAIGK